MSSTKSSRNRRNWVECTRVRKIVCVSERDQEMVCVREGERKMVCVREGEMVCGKKQYCLHNNYYSD